MDWWAQRPKWLRLSAWLVLGGVVVTIGNVGGVVTKVWAAIDGYIATKPYVAEQNANAAKQVIDALGPRFDVITAKLASLQMQIDGLDAKSDAQSDEVTTATIVSASSSITSLTAQIAALQQPLADYPFNIALLKQQQSLQTQLDNMTTALARAVCRRNQRRQPGFVCPGN